MGRRNVTYWDNPTRSLNGSASRLNRPKESCPLPSQLARGQISPEFRALTWRMLKQELESTRDVTLVPARVGEPWRPILQVAQVRYDHSLDDFPAPYQTPCVSFEV